MPKGTVIDVQCTHDSTVIEVWDFPRSADAPTRYRIGLQLGRLPPSFGDSARWEQSRMILYIRRAMETAEGAKRGCFGDIEEFMIVRRPKKIET